MYSSAYVWAKILSYIEERLGAVTEGYILRRLDRPLKSLNFWKNLTLPGQ